MGRNVKWVHPPAHEAASHWLPDGYSLPIGGTRVASRLPFAIGETLTLYEAARIISGRHPYPLSPDGVTTLGPRIGLISAGSTGLTRRRHRPLRAKEAFEALQQKVMSGEIHGEEMPRLSRPGEATDGGIDWLNTKVKTSDVVALCEERGWRVRFEYLRPVEPVAIGAPAGNEAPGDVEAECREIKAALVGEASEPTEDNPAPGKSSFDEVSVPRKRSRPAIESAQRAIKELFPGDIPDQATVPNALLFRKVHAKIKEAGRPIVSEDTILRAAGRRK